MNRPFVFAAVCLVVAYLFAPTGSLASELHAIFPAGGKAGSSTPVAFHGSGIDSPVSVRCDYPNILFEKTEKNEFIAHVSSEMRSGQYDVQVMTAAGISSSRTFFVTGRTHVVEEDADSTEETVQQIPLGCAISGRVSKGDIDEYRFTAKRGQRVVIECWSHRIDSSLRAILEVRDSSGKLLASSRGYFGIDPAIPFSVPADGEYTVRLHDLIYSGSLAHFYRLDVHTGPRVVFALPPIVRRDAATPVTFFGWNLKNDNESTSGNSTDDTFEMASVVVTHTSENSVSATRRSSRQVDVPSFAYYFDGADVPVSLGLSDLPVGVAQGNDSSSAAFAVEIPSETVGQLTETGGRDWYALDVKRGEVLYFEATGQRLDSPVDLDLSVYAADDVDMSLVGFHDEIRNAVDIRFPTSHLDPSGRWVAPNDGRYLVSVRNLIGGIEDDQRRVYALSVRREEPSVSLVAIAPGAAPTGVNLQRGGRAIVDVMAFRKRGLDESIRVFARNLPSGLIVPDVWLGPGVDSVPLMIEAHEDCQDLVTSLNLVAEAPGVQGEVTNRGDVTNQWDVQSGMMVRSGVPAGSGRLTQQLPVLVSGQSPIRLLADGHEPVKHHLYGELQVRHSPGGILDVAIKIERREAGHSATVKLSAVGLPEAIRAQVVTVPEGEDKAYISFFLPRSLPIGTYSIVIRGETSVPAPGGNVVVHSNPVTFKVKRPAFRIDVDPSAPRTIGRGQVVQIPYTARRIDGFIGKIHTELAKPGAVTEVGRLRARGVTFVGQTESGTIQIIANEDAELGRIPFLRLYGVGVVEDEPMFHGCCFLELETVE